MTQKLNTPGQKEPESTSANLRGNWQAKNAAQRIERVLEETKPKTREQRMAELRDKIMKGTRSHNAHHDGQLTDENLRAYLSPGYGKLGWVVDAIERGDIDEDTMTWTAQGTRQDAGGLICWCLERHCRIGHFIPIPK